MESDLVLLTGATGFVGRQVLKSLAESGTKVRIVTRRQDIKSLLGHEAIEEAITTEDMFSESPAFYEQICKDITSIINCAWYVEHGEYLDSWKNFDCLAGTIELAKAAVYSGVKKFTGIGTCLEYELGDDLLTTATPIRPRTNYAAAKAATFFLLENIFSQSTTQFIWARLFFLYGEKEAEGRLAPYIREQITAGREAQIRNSELIRDYMDVETAGRLVAEISKSDHSGPINICTGKGTRIKDFAIKIASQYGDTGLLSFSAPNNLLSEAEIIIGDPNPT